MNNGKFERIDVSKFLSVKIRGYKSFTTSEGFNTFRPINIIIGRNNAGKTALLELVEMLCDKTVQPKIPRDACNTLRPPVISFEYTIKKEVESVVPGIAQLLENQGPTYQFIREQFIGFVVQGTVDANGVWVLREESCMDHLKKHGIPEALLARPMDESRLETVWREYRSRVHVTYSKVFSEAIRKLSADRNITPEPEKEFKTFDPNGTGATNLFRLALNTTDSPREKFREEILHDLNLIFNPEMKFSKIEVIQQSGGTGKPYEIFLTEEGRPSIPVAHMGHGVKTVLLVLANLILHPWTVAKTVGEKKDEQFIDIKRRVNDFVFCFEELENNLHPAILRRLLDYLAKTAVDQGCLVFVTTHSHIPIDQFSKDENAQILHVRWDESGEETTESGDKRRTIVDNVSSHLRRKNVFFDLDFRASDLLQSNAVIWVEGPSDRYYLNRWINLMTGGDLKENVHYQILHSGGSIISHLFFGDPEKEAGEGTTIEDRADEESSHEDASNAESSDEESSDDSTKKKKKKKKSIEDRVKECIHVLKINPHPIVMADSDMKNEDSDLKEVIEAVEKEVLGMHGIMWISAGKEVENYIHPDVLRMLFPKHDVPMDDATHGNVFDYIKARGGPESLTKVDLAKRVCGKLGTEHLDYLDLRKRVAEVCNSVYKWNHKEKPTGVFQSLESALKS